MIHYVCKYSHSGNWNETYKWAETFTDPSIKFPCDLSEFGEEKPNYDGNNIIHPLQNAYGLWCDYMNYRVHIVDLPNNAKYELVKPSQCLCFAEPFSIKKIDDK